MKKYLISLLFVSFFGHAGTALDSALKPWSPTQIQRNGDALHIVLPQAKVTDGIYKSVVKMGLCPVVWEGKADDLKGVAEVALLNQFGKQGYVVEEVASTCTEMGKLTGAESDTYLLGKTRLY
ncbi:hypothetical protein OB925_16270 [Aeromonas rivipollensis]|uniref:hypothetical protein n=1 Tax=Aeromonas rivipollensis TaxID=948519 RepID=UPI00259FC658|nr:hypothetical protein [Aeromonas rivipollensis]MDM5086246.1 hypothetical protein [Aeromonas rivipollensis]MDM5098765.1 hypothetical protein [Aeromonas rivipollensis]MDM5107272.1 hypothetical protein [Aeromonas rivipollensis]